MTHGGGSMGNFRRRWSAVALAFSPVIVLPEVLPSTGFTGLMSSTAGGSFSAERGTSVARRDAPSECTGPGR